MMNLFREYGITKEEVENTLSDAINFVDKHNDGCTEGLADRLMELSALFAELTKEYDK